ncbi:hypothetical protein F5879DRAFT_716876 [Lentinula edodes]|nr:hypothetical protein F5879DRAFT_716876 [Lentinula edodes]
MNIRFKKLILVSSTVTIHSKSTGRLFGVLLSKGDTCAERNLSANNSVSSEKRSEDVHETTLAAKRSYLATDELFDNVPNRSPTKNSQRVTTL